MKPTSAIRASARSTLLLASMLSPALRAQAVARPAVELTQNGCAQVSEGDTVAFEWNPGFEHGGSVTGMQKVYLLFARRGEEEQTRQRRAGILLIATKPAERATPHDSSIATLPNGFYRATFRPFLHGVEPGEYRLVDARGDAQVGASYRGAHPEMTNSPLRSSYCLNVVAAQ